jgi:UDP-N-acetyl-D-mannosaminuronate dehydrogenase
MSNDTAKTPPIACVTVEPGICGLPCTIKAQKSGNRTVTIEINGSECKQIQRLSTCLTEMSLKELFMPLTRNPVYIAAEKSGCHPSCAIPAAVIKAVEVALGMALPREVRIKFTNETNEKEDRGTD